MPVTPRPARRGRRYDVAGCYEDVYKSNDLQNYHDLRRRAKRPIGAPLRALHSVVPTVRCTYLFQRRWEPWLTG